MIRNGLGLIGLCLLLNPSLADDPVWTSQRGLFVVSFQSELQPLQINVLHAWILHIEDEKGIPVVGAEIETSGGMPEHDHGLPTRPRVTRELGGGDYRLEGMRFHMAGKWELSLTIAAAGKRDTVVVAVDL